MAKSAEVIPPCTAQTVIDSTKINDFLRCPRLFFYHYIVGWQKTPKGEHLRFGSAFHEGMEVLELHNLSAESVRAACERFLEAWEEEGCPEVGKKTAEAACFAYADYASTHKRNVDEILFTEVNGLCPIGPGRSLAFRIDSVRRGTQGVYAREHKTGSRLDAKWRRRWKIAMQPHAYRHVLHCCYDKVFGVEINAIHFERVASAKKDENPSGCSFGRELVRHNMQQMDNWLWEVNHYLDMIDWHREALSACTTEDRVMKAFPRQPNACMDFGRCCPFHAMCVSWANPLPHLDTVPEGFAVDHWNPLEKDSKAVFDGKVITKKGDNNE